MLFLRITGERFDRRINFGNGAACSSAESATATRPTPSRTEIMFIATSSLRRSFPVLRVARAGLDAALLTLAWVLAPAIAAEKPFKQSALDQAAIKLEAQIKSDAGAVAKPAATLRRDADTAFQKNEFRSGMVVLSQLVTVAPDDASSWLRLARTILQIKPRDDREKALLFDRASTAGYIAYQRAGDRNLEADSLSVLGRTLSDRQQWRGALDSLRLSLELR